MSCSPIEPSQIAVLASLISVERYSLPLDIDYASITGVDQVNRSLDPMISNPPDFLITAIPAYVLRAPQYAAFGRYKLLIELNLEKERILQRRSLFPSSKGEVVVYRHSTAEEHIRLHPDLMASLKPYFEDSFDRVLKATKEASFIVAWEPLSTVLEHRGWRPIPNSEHESLIAIFASSELLKTDDESVMMFLDLLLYEWNYCLHNMRYSLARLSSNGFREKIAASCGLQISQMKQDEG